MFIVLTFIALVASFSIISNLIMLVTEKAREVAILKAMGARDGAILRVFFAEGLYIGLLGLVLGIGAGRRGLPACSSATGCRCPPTSITSEAAGGHARRRDRRGRPGGAGAVLPGHHLPGAAGLHACGRSRPPVRMSESGLTHPGNPS